MTFLASLPCIFIDLIKQLVSDHVKFLMLKLYIAFFHIVHSNTFFSLDGKVNSLQKDIGFQLF